MKAHKIVEGQLRPLEDRMSHHQRERRQNTINTRSSMAREIGAVKRVAFATFQVLNRGFFGRLWWLLSGR